MRSDRPQLLLIAATLVALSPSLAAGDSDAGGGREIRLDRLEHLTSKDGLAHNWILDVYQDREGFLWIGTGDGLHRYDGYSLKVYRSDPDDPRTLADNRIQAVLEDRQGNLWVGTRGGLHRLDRASGTFTRFRHDPAEAQSLSDDYVFDILEDRSGTLWIATRDGLDRFDPPSSGFERFFHDADDPSSLSDSFVRSIHESRSGELWFGTRGATLNLLDRPSGRFLRFPLLEEDAAAQAATSIRSIAEDAGGRLWLGTRGVLVRFDPRTGERRQYLEDVLEGGVCLAVRAKADGSLWVGTESSGLVVLEPETGELSVFRHDPDDPGTLSAGRIMTVYEDRAGVTWIGTDAGLDKFVPAREQFALYRHKSGDPGSLDGDFVSSVEEDRQGRLWIGGAGTGLNVLDRARGVKIRYTHDPDDPHSLASNDIVTTFEDRAGTMWIGTFRGLDRFDAERQSFLHVSRRSGEPTGRIDAVAERGDGELWVGGVPGLCRLVKPATRLECYRHDPENPAGPPAGAVFDLLFDRGGELWIATVASGLSRFDPRRETFRHYRHDPGDPGSLSHDVVSALHESREGSLWVGTVGGGLNRFDPERESFVHYREKDGLPNDQIWAILEDDRGRLWLSSSGGLTRFDPRAGKMKTYDVRDGLQDNVFIIGSAFRSPSGEMFFGGPSGLTAFHPDRLESDPHAPVVAITDFQLFNRSTPLAGRLEPAADGDGVPHLVLGYRDVVFAFEFAALHFAQPEKNRYAHRLEGFDRGWVETGAGQRVAQYTNLDPGDYVFRVRASNPDGVWNEEGTAVGLTVLPPPWRTWWAYAFYVLALAAVVLGYVRSRDNELRRERQAAERERQVNAQLREVDRLKDEFLANTSHELRTPLYGITGLVESLIDGAAGELPTAAKSHLAMVAASGRRLTTLVDDILDFSKLKHHSLELEPRPVDLHTLVDVVLALLRPLAGSKDLVLTNAVAADLPPVLADENRLQQILHNLVGNAIKFTEAGSVEVAAEPRGDRLVVAVRDTGIGIPREQQERIFEAFSQADGTAAREFGGTGLGLAVTRQLVELHGATLSVESTPGQGATFYFDLPVAPCGAAAVAPAAVAPLVTKAEPGVAAPAAADALRPPAAGADAARLLVVDDEPVIRQVLVNQLAADGHAIVQAASGAEALKHVEEQPCDLVLLDVMMPRMSGYEVCRTLRERYTLDELPVIFLTAKNQVEDLVVGLAAGANDYLPKPISKSELLARVRTHLALLDVHRQLSFMVTERDVQLAERERLLAERERLIGELEARNADLARFNYTVSHDLKNPLVTIKNFLGALRHDAAPAPGERLEHHLQCLESAADQMHRLLDELFEFSQVGVLPAAAETVALDVLVAEALKELSQLVSERRAEIVVADDLPAVRGDRVRLRELVRHLLENAIKHLGDGEQPRVKVGVEWRDTDPDRPVFYVRDNGPGIEPCYHDKIFGLFERLAPAASEGTGIGLALVKRIVEVHGGRIWVESQGKGRGSAFCFTLR